MRNRKLRLALCLARTSATSKALAPAHHGPYDALSYFDAGKFQALWRIDAMILFKSRMGRLKSRRQV